jgi:DNA anti-recombination protein RmuC
MPSRLPTSRSAAQALHRTEGMFSLQEFLQCCSVSVPELEGVWAIPRRCQKRVRQMPKAKIKKLTAEIERLKTELRDAKTRNTEIIRQNVEASNIRENKLNQAHREIERLKEQIAKLRKKSK